MPRGPDVTFGTIRPSWALQLPVPPQALLKRTTMEDVYDPAFWVAVGQIIMIDILLGGDNAVVIALACRKLPARAAHQGHHLGHGRRDHPARHPDLLCAAAAGHSFLKLVGALLLLVWIGVKLLPPMHDDDHGDIRAATSSGAR
jgi:predicted tellurium resistance membrane protein TerC